MTDTITTRSSRPARLVPRDTTRERALDADSAWVRERLARLVERLVEEERALRSPRATPATERRYEFD